ncbi:protein phosphatase 2C family protein [Methanospirillum sp. J.3.6.1-F.2.7.3]|uniref:Protein phosphatase 2C family protein n=1 Tax=Methanospirillum purgamenti TaxID=2834276 RepID=A0A8E7EJX2_9EURY|nr:MULTISPECIES: PP2C family serine/threonine-protein phosphatase [Methanospirillum]MDX8549817.1 PP2C family serine/threonine-protein phosphatase [Methanospirillum hungatei]QVV89549.1 protein phosphatase 2C family protein [Methanospirillum sp. J.3.6.1-F.2.7.3]
MTDSGLNKFLACGASVAGTRHIRDLIPCEDAWAHDTCKDFLVLAVADGLSSAEYGGKGAEIAVHSSIQAAVQHLIQVPVGDDENNSSIQEKPDCSDIVHKAIRSGRNDLITHAESEDIPLSSLATTILIALLSSEGVTCGHIGDGACAILSGNEVSLLSVPGNTEYANETAVLTQNNWEKSLRISFGPADAVLLATDGCQGALIRKENGQAAPYIPFISSLVQSLKRFYQEGRDCNVEIADLLSSSRMRALSSDDLTLAVGFLISGESA